MKNWKQKVIKLLILIGILVFILPNYFGDMKSKEEIFLINVALGFLIFMPFQRRKFENSYKKIVIMFALAIPYLTFVFFKNFVLSCSKQTFVLITAFNLVFGAILGFLYKKSTKKF